MKLFGQLNRWFTQYLSFIVIAVAAVSLLFPALFLWAANWTTFFLQIIMLTMGLTMKPSDFSAIFKKPQQVILGVFLQYFWVPLAAFFITRLFSLSPEMTIGLILLGSCPGGTSSNVITFLANGKVPLSITITSVSTLIAPVMTPLMMLLYSGEYLDVSFTSMFLSIVQVVIIPIVIGLILSKVLNEKIEKVKIALPSFSSLGVLLVIAGTVAVNRDNLLQTGATLFVIVLLHNLISYLLPFIVCKLMKMDTATTRAMSIAVGIQNTGLSANLGLLHFSPVAALPGAAGAILHTIIGTVLASICRRIDAKKAKLANTDTVA